MLFQHSDLEYKEIGSRVHIESEKSDLTEYV
jgi:hypothetical protein